jgi:hypothetical protein
MIDPDEAYSLGQSMKESARRGLRQIILLALILGVLASISFVLFEGKDGDAVEEVFKGFMFGIFISPPIWLLYKFFAFVFPGSYWRSMRR